MQDNSRKEVVVETDEPPDRRLQTCDTPPCKYEEPAIHGVPRSLWNDWRWQIQNRIRSVPELLKRFPGLARAQDVARVASVYPMAITPHYASLIRRPDRTDPVFAMSVPQVEELFDPPFLSSDPLEEEKRMPVPCLVHRYHDRALVLATTMCAMYCRHCTRKRVAGTRESAIGADELGQIVDYLKKNPAIRDVIISGGDPFTLPTPVLEKIIASIRSVESVEIIRIGTRTPVVLPQRITRELTAMLRRYHPLWINTHFNHPAEITGEAASACARLADAGIPLGNQTVLLRGVNDDPVTMEHLFRSLVRMRVRPYYLFQCDLVKGVEHFRTPIQRGLQIMEHLRARVSGLAIPAFVVDAPGGAGKIPLIPDYVVERTRAYTKLRNGEGRQAVYPEPADLSRDGATQGIA